MAKKSDSDKELEQLLKRNEHYVTLEVGGETAEVLVRRTNKYQGYWFSYWKDAEGQTKTGRVDHARVVNALAARVRGG